MILGSGETPRKASSKVARDTPLALAAGQSPSTNRLNPAWEASCAMTDGTSEPAPSVKNRPRSKAPQRMRLSRRALTMIDAPGGDEGSFQSHCAIIAIKEALINAPF